MLVNQAYVLNENGEQVALASLWKQRRAIIAFNRHMGCRFCKEQTLMIEDIIKHLEDTQIVAIVVTIGNYKDIPRFREETSFSGEIYVDEDPHNPRCYKTLDLANGGQYLFDPATNNTEFLPSTKQAAIRAAARGIVDGGYGDGTNPYTGDILQIGGVFVVGPGNCCDFAFRSQYVGDVPDMNDVVTAATGRDASNNEILYASTAKWNSNLQTSVKIQPPKRPMLFMATNAAQRTVTQITQLPYGKFVFPLFFNFIFYNMIVHLMTLVDNKIYSISQKSVVPISACGAVLCACSSLLFYFYSRLQGDILLSKKAINSKDEIISKTKEIKLYTIRELDALAVSNGKQKCECSFLASINMSQRSDDAKSDTLNRTSVNSDANSNIHGVAVNVAHQPPLSFPSPSADGIISTINDPVASTVCYVREFLAKSNPLLGRKGPTCPFVPASLKMDVLYIGQVMEEDAPDIDHMEVIVRGMLDRFKVLQPVTGAQSQYKAVILIFPEITLEDAPTLIDGLQKKLKLLFVSEGLMLGEFHLHNNSAGLHNSSFFPLRTPYPCLAIRNMVPSDIVFLNGTEFSVEQRLNMIQRYLDKFADYGTASEKHSEEIKVATELVSKLKSTTAGCN